jgi:aspartate kinase
MLRDFMSTLVMKFGGASVATPESFAHIADIIIGRLSRYSRVAVVVSAMGDTTDYLIELAKKVNAHPPRREMDMLVSVGERISISLLAMALAAKGVEAVSFTGSQCGIITTSDHTEARILDVRPYRLLPHLEAKRVAIVAGFQGVGENRDITTLGRGGSDTTAVALGVALEAEKVEFFKDVAGIYDRDPREWPEAKLLSRLTYEESLQLVAASAHAVLHPRSLRLAAQNSLPLHVLSFADAFQMAGTHEEILSKGTWIRDHAIQRPQTPAYEGSVEATC